MVNRIYRPELQTNTISINFEISNSLKPQPDLTEKGVRDEEEE